MSKSISKLVAAVVIYIGFAIYLYQPYFKKFNGLQYLIVVNVCLASLGCFLLSRRWVIGFGGSFFAGVIYGFGPFMLSLTKFHPTAGLLAAAVPWLFCPAAFGPKAKWRWLRMPLSALPFLAILLFFQVSAYCRLFAIPIQARLHLADLLSLLAPLVVVQQSSTLVGFYHVPIAALVMGLSMLLAARRFGIMIIFCLGAMLAFCGSFLSISPIMWLAIPVLCCSVLVGAGMQGLTSAGFADRRWVLMAATIAAVLSFITLLLATKYYSIFTGFGSKYARVLVETAKMYILGAIAVAIVYFMACAKLRVHWLRWGVLGLATVVDVFFSARFIVDKIF
jgi:hypothetical protein